MRTSLQRPLAFLWRPQWASPGLRQPSILVTDCVRRERNVFVRVRGPPAAQTPAPAAKGWEERLCYQEAWRAAEMIPEHDQAQALPQTPSWTDLLSWDLSSHGYEMVVAAPGVCPHLLLGREQGHRQEAFSL